jgi:hypothetical protein
VPLVVDHGALIDRLANRVFTRRTTGLDGLAKRLIAKQAPPSSTTPNSTTAATSQRETPRPYKQSQAPRLGRR